MPHGTDECAKFIYKLPIGAIELPLRIRLYLSRGQWMLRWGPVVKGFSLNR